MTASFSVPTTDTGTNPQDARDETPAPGALDGLTILRYAHAFESGGGVENYLSDLNRALGARNAVTTVQLQLTHDAERMQEKAERLSSRATLVKVPLLVREKSARGAAHGARGGGGQSALPGRVFNFLMPTSGINDLVARTVLARRNIPVRAGEPADAGAKTAAILQRYNVDLVVLHTSGGADASEVAKAARKAGVPVALMHHFSNDRLGGISFRQQASLIAAVGGASGVDVPRFLQKRFYNLSDAVDLNFFRPENARRNAKAFSCPVIYAPGRLTPAKGQLDVIRLAALLRQRGLPTQVVFAGRVDSPAFEIQLKEAVAKANLTDAVTFAGQLTPEQYRDWFGAASVLVMPTHHHEGMPRTVIESQAMMVPPIVYDIGGTREGLRDGETGFLVPYDRLDAMADAVERLLRDSERRERMASAGRRFVEQHFSLESLAARHEQFYLDVLRRQRRTAGSPSPQ